MIKFGKEYVGRKAKSVRGTITTPNKGTGVITDYDDDCVDDMHYMVKFDCYSKPHWVYDDSIELVEADVSVGKDTVMSYDEIWKMLEPKMEKNGLNPYVFSVRNLNNYGVETWRNIVLYKPEDFERAVAFAYKMGHERAMKGRPFKYGDGKVNVTIDNLDEVEGDECPNAPCWVKPIAKKKVKPMGHWEKVDPNHLPDLGSKVKYARYDGEKHLNPINIGKEGRFDTSNTDLFGLRDENDNWYDFHRHLDCLDVWTEEDGDAE